MSVIEKNNNWNARDYANNSTAQLLWAVELISKLNLTEIESILDIGCGDGKITAAIAAELNKGTVWGIDRSSEMISFAKENYPSSQYPNLFFQQMDALSIAFDRQFDAIFSNAALHWIDNHLEVLKKAHLHLRPNGRILWQMGGKNSAKDLVTIIDRIQKSSPWQKYFTDFQFPYYFYDTTDYECWLQETGFKIIRLELIDKDIRHSGKEGLKGWLRTTWFPFTDCLPEGLKEQFLEEIIDNYLRDVIAIDRDGNTCVKMVRLEVEAVKIGE